MNKNSAWLLNSFRVLVVLILLFLSAQTQPISAQVGDLRRDKMIQIAERYTTYKWTASNDNILHAKRVIGGVDWQVDSADQETDAGRNAGGWWNFGENTGVPYQWGGFSALGDADLGLPRQAGRYFNNQLDEGFAAGDIFLDNKKGVYSGAAGVDCSGLVSRAWAMGSKQGTGVRLSSNGPTGLFRLSRPIKFRDLRPGDILISRGHVVLFKRFLTQESDTENVTRFEVIEASAKDWRVSEREYTLTNINPIQEQWRQRSYATDQVTIQWSNSSYDDYYPRTYITPIDVILVIDRSGSMSGEKMTAAKNSAKFFVDMMRTGDKIGVVDFDNLVTTTYPLTEITAAGTVKIDAKNAIDTLTARGNTSIGGGLQAGLDALNAAPAADPVKLMVLLSDGQENTSPSVASVLPAVVSGNVAVHAIGLGSGANESLLLDIATSTGGVYKFSPSANQLWEIYNAISNFVYGNEIALTATGTVTTGGTSEQRVLVDSSVGKATFSVFWPGSDLDLTLVQPDGTVINPQVAENDPFVSFVSGPTYEYYEVEGPQPGEWTLQILGVSTDPGGEDYSVAVSVSGGISLDIQTDQTEYGVGVPIHISASLQDSFLDVTEPQYILGAVIQARVTDPALAEYQFELYDDGLHNDGDADDGIYANDFLETALAGSYNLDFLITGNNLRDEQPFTREAALSVVVSGVANQPPTLQAPTDVTMQYSDELVLNASAADPNDPAGDLVFSVASLPGSLLLTDHHDGTATVSGILDLAPGSYPIEWTVTDPAGLTDVEATTITVSKEDAIAAYTGPSYLSTISALTSKVTVPLRATIQDITALATDPVYDPYPGNITNATVSFVDRKNANKVLCTSNVVLIDSDATVGTAACKWPVNLGLNYSLDYTIGIIVDGYYTRDSADDDALIIVSKPNPNFVAGGGFILNENSAGKYAGDAGEKTNFGLSVKYTPRKTFLLGQVSMLVNSNGHLYWIRSSSLTSLAATPYQPKKAGAGIAELVGKVTIFDVTNWRKPIIVETGINMLVSMKDNGEPGKTDTIGITLWHKNGTLLYSSNWNGAKTIPQVLKGGNLLVH